jgi:hypothetical protein
MMGGYVVSNPAKGSQYCATPYSDRIECACADYANQLRFYGRGVCKHGYAVLHTLGFSDLRSYLAGEKVAQPIIKNQLTLSLSIVEALRSAAATLFLGDHDCIDRESLWDLLIEGDPDAIDLFLKDHAEEIASAIRQAEIDDYYDLCCL